MKKFLDDIKRDLWVVLLDMVAVNLSYFLALIVRFFVGGFLRPVAVDRYLPAFISFAPFYTIGCVVVFIAWKLYGGLWRYAGVNDMNRIIGATLCTALLHIMGTVVFVERMPITYYLIGTVLQFLFVVSIRFGYRVLLVEKRRLRRGEKINTVVVGSGENGRRVVKNLEESEIYLPTSIYSASSKGGVMDGIPIVGELKLENVGAVFITDPLMSGEERNRIQGQAEAAGVEFHDYTGYFSNLGGRLSLTELMSTIRSPITIELDGKEIIYQDGAEALRALPDKYEVKSIEGQAMKIKLERGRTMSTQDTLQAAYVAVMGEETGGQP